MDRSLKPLDVAYGGALSGERQRVLRNTYALLALSMVPTVLGAWMGVALNFSFFAGSPLIGFVVFMAVAFGFFYAIEKNKNSGLGVILLLGFTFFMGLMLSRMIGRVLGFSNGAQLIALAFGGHGHAGQHHQARHQRHGQVADGGRHRVAAGHRGQHLPAVAGADADHLGPGRGDLLGLHPVRPEASGRRR